MKKAILFLLACLALSGCAYCKRCFVNNGEQTKADMDKTFNGSVSKPVK